MTDDALKALLLDAETSVPAQDARFALDVMARIERRRLIEGVVNLAVTVIFVSFVLYFAMPYLTPVLIVLAQASAPAIAALTAVGLAVYIWMQVRPAFSQYRLRL